VRGTAVAANSRPVDVQQLVGTWRVDLRSAPGAADYYKQFVVTSVTGKAFTGTFYDTEITQGRVTSDWGTVEFAFVTNDGRGDYHHSGWLVDGVIRGLTNAPHRDFLAHWTAERAAR
jgi:hypothetical protein